MLVTVALLLLAAWLLGVIGLYELGRAVHVLFLVGLMLLMLGVLKGRDETARQPTRTDRESP